MTILVVEDHPEVRELYVAALTEKGYQVRQATDGLHGLDLVSKTKPELVFTDLRMPSMDGLSFARAVRADPANDHVPIILITATPLIRYDKRLFADILVKPCSLVNMCKLASKFLAPDQAKAVSRFPV